MNARRRSIGGTPAILAFSGGSTRLKKKIEAALNADVDLQEFWSVSADLIDCMKNARATQS